MIIACVLLIFSRQFFENLLLNEVFMISCMKSSWAQWPQNDGSIRNDGATAPNTQQLHHRLSHINRTLHADIEKPTTLEKTFNYLHKINS